MKINRLPLILLGAVLALTFATYSATLHFGFVYDDIQQIRDNQFIRSAKFLPSYFVRDVWAVPSSSDPLDVMPSMRGWRGTSQYYRPVFLAWLLGNFQLFALSASGWHLMSILAHMLVTVLVYMLARRLTRNDYAALTAAGLFALHPLNVEAVAWVSAVNEPLCAAFVIGSFLAYLEYRQAGRFSWIVASVAFYAMALLSKETAAVLPGVIAVYESLSPSASHGLLQRCKRFTLILSPFALCLGLYVAIRIHVVGKFAILASAPLRIWLLNLPSLLWFAARRLLLPTNLGPAYDRDLSSITAIRQCVWPMCVLMALVAVLYWLRRQSNSLLPVFLAGWFLLTLAPSFALLLMMRREIAVQDRYVYLPSVAFSILAALVIFPKQETRAEVWHPAAAILALAVLGAMSYNQTLFWQTDERLFNRGSQTAPHSAYPKMQLYESLRTQRRYKEALAVTQEAMMADPSDPEPPSVAASVAYTLGNYAEAETYAVQALKLQPKKVEVYYFAVRPEWLGTYKFEPIDGMNAYYLGAARYMQEKFSAAVPAFRLAASIRPYHPMFQDALASSLAQTGDWAGAREHWKAALASPQAAQMRDRFVERIALAETRMAQQERPKRVAMPRHHEAPPIDREAQATIDLVKKMTAGVE